METKSLGQLLRRPPRYGINAAAVPIGLGVPTYIRITDIDDSGRFAPNPRVGVDHPKSSDYQIGVGELLFARTGASVGKSYLYDPRDGALVYAGFLINVAPDPRLLNPKYLSLYAHTKDYWDWIARTSVRSGQPGVNGREYAQLPIPVPNIEVQNAIADVMNDVDDLIAALQRMIAKKQAIKQGMMQQLLTGQTRLPGFTSTWGSVTLAEISSFITKGATPTTYGFEWERSGIPFLRSECVAEGGLDMRQSMHISLEAHRSLDRSRIVEGDILITITGNVGRVVIYDGIGEANINQHIARVRVTHPEYDNVFVYQFLSQPSMRRAFEAAVTGQAYPQISLAQVRAASIPAVSLNEQQAIASHLFDVDSEIDLLRLRWSKAKAVKRGMMQELLAGRTRLPLEGALA